MYVSKAFLKILLAGLFIPLCVELNGIKNPKTLTSKEVFKSKPGLSKNLFFKLNLFFWPIQNALRALRKCINHSPSITHAPSNISWISLKNSKTGSLINHKDLSNRKNSINNFEKKKLLFYYNKTSGNLTTRNNDTTRTFKKRKNRNTSVLKNLRQTFDIATTMKIFDGFLSTEKAPFLSVPSHNTTLIKTFRTTLISFSKTKYTTNNNIFALPIYYNTRTTTKISKFKTSAKLLTLKKLFSLNSTCNNQSLNKHVNNKNRKFFFKFIKFDASFLKKFFNNNKTRRVEGGFSGTEFPYNSNTDFLFKNTNVPKSFNINDNVLLKSYSTKVPKPSTLICDFPMFSFQTEKMKSTDIKSKLNNKTSLNSLKLNKKIFEEIKKIKNRETKISAYTTLITNSPFYQPSSPVLKETETETLKKDPLRDFTPNNSSQEPLEFWFMKFENEQATVVPNRVENPSKEEKRIRVRFSRINKVSGF